MKHFQSLLDLSEQVLAALCVCAFVAMFVLGIATVVFRFLLESSLAFPDELIRYLFIWAVFLGSAVAYRRNMHAAIGLVVARLAPQTKRFALLSATVLSAGFFVLVGHAGILLTIRAAPQISPALEVSMAWVMAAVPVGMGLLALYAIELFYRQWHAELSDLAAEDA